MIVVSLHTVLCADGDLRLAGGTTDGQGRVEICIGEVWGTICDNGWDNTEAQVACRNLGFSGASMCHASKDTFFIIFLQLPQLSLQPSLVRALVLSSWKILGAQEGSAAYWTVLIVCRAPVRIAKMLVFAAKEHVSSNSFLSIW